MFKALERLVRIFAENVARRVDRRDFLKTVVGGAFMTMLAFVANPLTAAAATPAWCQATYSGGSCSPPNGKYCSSCPSATGTTKCPSGYKVSYAWGYTSTGCWCHASSTGTRVCCDCTLSGNSAYSRYSSDCGCGFNTPHVIY